MQIAEDLDRAHLSAAQHQVLACRRDIVGVEHDLVRSFPIGADGHALARFMASAALALVAAAPANDPPAWTQPTAPFRIAGNIYYVGTQGLASYLIVTPKGLILLDPTMEENVPAIEANIKALGFKLSDIKILLNSHAHFDHARMMKTRSADVIVGGLHQYLETFLAENADLHFAIGRQFKFA